VINIGAGCGDNRALPHISRAAHSASAGGSLYKLAEGKSILHEDYAREMIAQEEMHMSEVDKMPRKPGETAK
jgi:hypothetical protein